MRTGSGCGVVVGEESTLVVARGAVDDAPPSEQPAAAHTKHNNAKTGRDIVAKITSSPGVAQRSLGPGGAGDD